MIKRIGTIFDSVKIMNKLIECEIVEVENDINIQNPVENYLLTALLRNKVKVANNEIEYLIITGKLVDQILVKDKINNKVFRRQVLKGRA